MDVEPGKSAVILKVMEHIMRVVPVKGGYRILGSPFIIEFSRKIDAEKLAQEIASGEEPFRIIGIVDKVENDNMYLVYATDLETACPFEMEITSEWITVHLRSVPHIPDRECAKTLLKIYDIIKEHYDPDAKLMPEEGW